jgi:serine-type D-Ala-D-Ala carboxypeptidase (penicillin-binding protein 5/6)
MARPVPVALRASLAALLAALLVGCFAPTAAFAAPSARPTQAQGPAPKAWIVVDVATGTVLAGDHVHDALRPASTSKVMTALTAVERLAPDAPVDVSPLAESQPASKINMKAGQQWRLSDTIASLLLASANDSAYALAEATSGSVDGFIAAENETARRLGMKDSTFADPAGLDDDTSYKGGPRMSAYDLGIVARNALAVPEIAQWAATRKYSFVDPTGMTRWLTNHNAMLPGGSRAYQFATGFKTGYTERAGHTLIATATKDGRSLIAVILDTYDTYGWATQLLEQGFTIPNENGTDTLPKVAVSSYSSRVATQQAFLAAARGTPTHLTAPLAAAATTTVPAPTTSTTEAAAPSSAVEGDTIASQGPAGDGGSGRRVNWLLVGAVVVSVAALAVLLRRRQVRRQRARRIARQRQRAAKIRSGGLTVIDPSYAEPTSTDSHVRVRRIDE